MWNDDQVEGATFIFISDNNDAVEPISATMTAFDGY